YPSFDRMLRALLTGEVECAALPAATRVSGAILEPLEALWRAVKGGAELSVTDETEVPVRFVLASPRGVALEDVKEILSQPAALRVLHFGGARLSGAIADAGAEILALPGLPDAPVRGFAVFPEAALARASRLAPLAGESLVWLGPPPEYVRPPRVAALPKAT